MLLGVDPSTANQDQPLPTTKPQVTFAYCKHLWMSNEHEKAYNQLDRFVNTFSMQNMQTNCSISDEMRDENRRLLSRCYMRLGLWQNKLGGITEDSINGILGCYEKATQHDPNWYKAWHSWAYTNFKVPK